MIYCVFVFVSRLLLSSVCIRAAAGRPPVHRTTTTTLSHANEKESTEIISIFVSTRFSSLFFFSFARSYLSHLVCLKNSPDFHFSVHVRIRWLTVHTFHHRWMAVSSKYSFILLLPRALAFYFCICERKAMATDEYENNSDCVKKSVASESFSHIA